MSEETKIFYYIGEEQTPYVSKINIPYDSITLRDFKTAIKKPNYKFFFRSTDADFGVVKEEITDDGSKLPVCENRIVAWLVPPEDDSVSSGYTNESTIQISSRVSSPVEEKPNSSLRVNTQQGHSQPDETNPVLPGMKVPVDRVAPAPHPNMRHPAHMREMYSSQSTLLSSDIDTTSWDSRSEMSDYSTLSESAASSRYHLRDRQRRKERKKRRPKPGSDTTSTCASSITDSTLSLNILTVNLNMEKYNFLGISIVGQSNDKGDGGIYIGSIMKGGAVAADGRIEPGDMLLQVNDINFENMSNEDAVRVLRNIVHKPGSISLTVAKCWDPNPDSSYFTIPKNEPVRPIDPAAWASHTMAVRGDLPRTSPPFTNVETSSASSLPESERYLTDLPLTIKTDMAQVVKQLKQADSGLDVRTRMWLKITIPNAFIGSDLIDWLQQKVEGLQERRASRKYASSMLKAGYIRHTVNKITFSEQCYYVFGEYHGPSTKEMMNLSLGDSNSDRDSDTLGPLPTTGVGGVMPWVTNPHADQVSSNGYASYSQFATQPTSQQRLKIATPPAASAGGNPPPTLNRVIDYVTSPPPSYGGLDRLDRMSAAASDAETLSVAGSVRSETSSVRHQHLATFGGGSGGSEGSGSSDPPPPAHWSSLPTSSRPSSQGSSMQQLIVRQPSSGNSSLQRNQLLQQPSPHMEQRFPRMQPPSPHMQQPSSHAIHPNHPPHSQDQLQQFHQQPHFAPQHTHNLQLQHNIQQQHQHYLQQRQQQQPYPLPQQQQHNLLSQQQYYLQQQPPHAQQQYNVQQQQPEQPPPIPSRGRPLAEVAADLAASRESFQHAMGNPCGDLFVDLM